MFLIKCSCFSLILLCNIQAQWVVNPANVYTIDSQGDTVFAVEASLMGDQIIARFPKEFRNERSYIVYVINVRDTAGNQIGGNNFATVTKPYIIKLDSLRMK